MSFWAYMLHCRGGYFYVGHTEDLEVRMAQHNAGEVRGFASDHLPAELVWCQEFPSRYEALQAERQIKGLESGQEDGADPRRLGADFRAGEK